MLKEFLNRYADISAPKILGLAPVDAAVNGKAKTPTHTGNEETDIDDTLGLYLREISTYPVLTRKEELVLTTTLARGRTFEGEKENLDSMRLTPEAQEAMDMLIHVNLRLVVSRAKRKLNSGHEFIELISAGNIGLMKGLAKFEPERGNKVSTYVIRWIDQMIRLEIKETSRTIRIPVNFYEWMRNVTKEKILLTQDLKREPTTGELADAVGCDETFLSEALNIIRKPLSFELPVGSGFEDFDDETVEDRVVDPQPPIEHMSEGKDTRETIRTIYFAMTDPREQAVIGLRNGFVDGHVYTLEEIGEMLHVSREMIRQIEARAEGKIHETMTRTYAEKLVDVIPDNRDGNKRFRASRNYGTRKTSGFLKNETKKSATYDDRTVESLEREIASLQEVLAAHQETLETRQSGNPKWYQTIPDLTNLERQVMNDFFERGLDIEAIAGVHDIVPHRVYITLQSAHKKYLLSRDRHRLKAGVKTLAKK